MLGEVGNSNSKLREVPSARVVLLLSKWGCGGSQNGRPVAPLAVGRTVASSTPCLPSLAFPPGAVKGT